MINDNYIIEHFYGKEKYAFTTTVYRTCRHIVP